ncbi:hypothetical protein UFOVP466_36 [uncultured Caudovirales phage]|uniref:Uncharacterized protein n=1 Tax=uncultured Caudovirales phage TaxID=2100421 RepID=A0A6J5R677_9CAUD|nr:hypothetical protein UFOVP466_36 [uncultured Caudovirales phage]CAB4180697.1 hypothetical protein UFOVP1045_83 [uncultured Caudovirales phage]CAB4190146.1 hypothetical protein UFOVP1194_37 [uncultured Caudovirales phage]CAB4221796.1 hypothetical protein UFOVP1641_33 [uncultured Caudovirales phage]
MSLTWDEIRARNTGKRTEADVARLLSDALGAGPDWLVVYRDWLGRWDLSLDISPANVMAFLRDSIEPSVSDPEAAAILATMRRMCSVRPRSGVGMTTVESLGEIRQTIREFGLRRATEMRHRAKPGDADKIPEVPAEMVERLCGILTRLAARIDGAECDCFCGRCPITASGTPVASFRHQYRVSPVVLLALENFVNSVGVETRGG